MKCTEKQTYVFELAADEIAVWCTALRRAALTSSSQPTGWEDCPFYKQHYDIVRLTGRFSSHHADLRVKLTENLHTGDISNPKSKTVPNPTPAPADASEATPASTVNVSERVALLEKLLTTALWHLEGSNTLKDYHAPTEFLIKAKRALNEKQRTTV